MRLQGDQGAADSRPANYDVDKTQARRQPQSFSISDFCRRGIRASPRSTTVMLASSGPEVHTKNLRNKDYNKNFAIKTVTKTVEKLYNIFTKKATKKPVQKQYEKLYKKLYY